MPRHDGSGGLYHSSKQKASRSRRGHSPSTYSKQKKALHADRYRQPYLDGSWKKDHPEETGDGWAPRVSNTGRSIPT